MTITETVRGQGLEWESLSGENIAQEMRRSSANPEYNLRLGPVTLRAETGSTLSFNDNIGLTKENRTADILITPSVGIHGHWQVSELNTINFDVGLGYDIYVFHSQYDNIVLAPDSLAQFNFFVGNILFNIHDGFSYQQDPTQFGQLSNTVRLSRFVNDAGIGATWDLGKFVLDLDYDHTNLWVLQSQYSYLSNQSDTVSPKVTVKVSKTIRAGLEANVSNVQYEESFQNNYISYSVGPFASIQFSDDISVQASAGLYLSDFDTGGGNGDTQNVSSYYANGGITQRINAVDTHSLTVGREFIPGLTSNFTERVYVNYTNSWQATQRISLGANVWWESLTDSAAVESQTSNRYGAGLSATDNLSDKMSASLSYQFLLKDSDPSILSYTQNLLTAGFRYQF